MRRNYSDGRRPAAAADAAGAAPTGWPVGPALFAAITVRTSSDPARRTVAFHDLVDYADDAARAIKYYARECRRRAKDTALCAEARADHLAAARAAAAQYSITIEAVRDARVFCVPAYLRRLYRPPPGAALPTGAPYLSLLGALAYPDQDRRQAALYDLCEYVRETCWSAQWHAKMCRSTVRENPARPQAVRAALLKAARLADRQAALAWRAARDCQPPPPPAARALFTPPRAAAAAARGGRAVQGGGSRGGQRLVPHGRMAQRGRR